MNSVESASISPVAMLSMADHINRTNASTTKSPKVFGFLLGTIKDKIVNILHSVELPYAEGTDPKKGRSVDVFFLRDRIEQCLMVYPEYKVVGWYGDYDVNGEGHDIEVMDKQIGDEAKSELCILLLNFGVGGYNPVSGSNKNIVSGNNSMENFIKAYKKTNESDKTKHKFSKINCFVNSASSEYANVVIDHLNHIADSNSDEKYAKNKKNIDTLTQTRDSINKLADNLLLIHEFVKNAQANDNNPQTSFITRKIEELVYNYQKGSKTLDSLDKQTDSLVIDALSTLTSKGNILEKIVEINSMENEMKKRKEFF
ncbi:hypothetical protein BB559_000542 [Furculomyces boomerangus]|uniref:JAB1/MPN/MOV34 metalloenzyme domain-containing protein n=1 Tax=Furculomyces boomerangus TaxID=61424 RepID=A0A2T9Z4Z5_9FUNG|nr:hypothetical protein BB559_000542 [Furculomyces boomerangus]